MFPYLLFLNIILFKYAMTDACFWHLTLDIVTKTVNLKFEKNKRNVYNIHTSIFFIHFFLSEDFGKIVVMYQYKIIVIIFYTHIVIMTQLYYY